MAYAQAALDKWRERTLFVAEQYGLPIPASDYVAFEAHCWNCHRAAPVFLWPGIKDWLAPPEPSPRTVRRRFSNTLKEAYPANGCIHCDALFGDFYLFDLLLDSLEYDEAGELAERFLNDVEPPPD